VQSDDYYPFELTFNSYQRLGSKKNRFVYNDGAERQDDLNLNIDLTKFRAYDPALGRWWQIDPLADQEDLVNWTPYNYSFNNPVRFNDPLGDCPKCKPDDGPLTSALKKADDFALRVAPEAVKSFFAVVAEFFNKFEEGGGGFPISSEKHNGDDSNVRKGDPDKTEGEINVDQLISPVSKAGANSEGFKGAVEGAEMVIKAMETKDNVEKVAEDVREKAVKKTKEREFEVKQQKSTFSEQTTNTYILKPAPRDEDEQ